MAPVMPIVVGLTLVAVAYLAGARAIDATQPAFKQLTFRRGKICCARFTPDGQTVISNNSWDGAPFAIMVTRLDTLASMTLDLGKAELQAVSRTGELALLMEEGEKEVLARVAIGFGGIRGEIHEVATGVRSAD